MAVGSLPMSRKIMTTVLYCFLLRLAPCFSVVRTESYVINYFPIFILMDAGPTTH